MRFSDIKGNDEVKRTLTAMVDSGRIPHALMFHEDEGSGAFAMAQAFLGYLFYPALAIASPLPRRASRLPQAASPRIRQWKCAEVCNARKKRLIGLGTD